ncbi:MAG: HNH endonuclease family protein [Bacteroidia bacterium]|nr:HNH endonuclease family protein [Bacteroidia bacterium]
MEKDVPSHFDEATIYAENGNSTNLAKDIETLQGDFARLKNGVFHPLMKTLFVAAEKKSLDVEIKQAFQIIENIAVRNQILGLKAGEAAVKNILEKIKSSKMIFMEDLISEFFNGFYPSDKKILEICHSKNFYADSSSKSLLRFLLIKINRHLSLYKGCDLSEPINFDKVEIEHIVPQNYSAWKEDLEKKAQWHLLEKDKSCINRLGNLTLLFKGGLIGDLTFSEKKKFYKLSPILITRNLCEYEFFGPEQINRRTEKLAQIIVENLYPNLNKKYSVAAKPRPIICANPIKIETPIPSSTPCDSNIPTATKPENSAVLVQDVRKRFSEWLFHFAKFKYNVRKNDAAVKTSEFLEYLSHWSVTKQDLEADQCFQFFEDGEDECIEPIRLPKDSTLYNLEEAYFIVLAVCENAGNIEGWVPKELLEVEYRRFENRASTIEKAVEAGLFEIKNSTQDLKFVRWVAPSERIQQTVSENSEVESHSENSDVESCQPLFCILDEFQPILKHFYEFTQKNPQKNNLYLLGDFGSYLKARKFSYDTNLKKLLEKTGVFDIKIKKKGIYVTLSNERLLKRHQQIHEINQEFISLLQERNTSNDWIPIKIFADYLTRKGKATSEKFQDFLESLGLFEFKDASEKNPSIRLRNFSMQSENGQTISSQPQTHPSNPDDIRCIFSEIQNCFFEFRKAHPSENGKYSLEKFLEFLKQNAVNIKTNKNFIEDPKSFLTRTGSFRILGRAGESIFVYVKPSQNIKRKLIWSYYTLLASNNIFNEWVRPEKLIDVTINEKLIDFIPNKNLYDKDKEEWLTKTGLFEVKVKNGIKKARIRAPASRAKTSLSNVPLLVRFYFKYREYRREKGLRSERMMLFDFRNYLCEIGLTWIGDLKACLERSGYFRFFDDGTFTFACNRTLARVRAKTAHVLLSAYCHCAVESEDGWVPIERVARAVQSKKGRVTGKFSEEIKKSGRFDARIGDDGKMYVRPVERKSYAPLPLLFAPKGAPPALANEAPAPTIFGILRRFDAPAMQEESADFETDESNPILEQIATYFQQTRRDAFSAPPPALEGAVKIMRRIDDLRIWFEDFASCAQPVAEDWRSLDDFANYIGGKYGENDPYKAILASGVFDFDVLAADGRRLIRPRAPEKITLYDAVFSVFEAEVEDWFWLFERFNPGLRDDEGFFPFLEFCRFLQGKSVACDGQMFVAYVAQRKALFLDGSTPRGLRIRWAEGAPFTEYS